MSFTLSIRLFDEKIQKVCQQEFTGTSAEDLAMLGAAKGYLEGLYEIAAPGQKERALMGYMDKVMEVVKPKEVDLSKLPPILTIPIQELVTKGSGVIQASTFRRRLQVEFVSDEALEEALEKLGLVKTAPAAGGEHDTPPSA